MARKCEFQRDKYMKTIKGTFGGTIQIFEEPNVCVILDDNKVFILPKEENPICFKPNNYEIQEDGTLVISKRMPLKQALERIERAGVDDPYEVLEKLIQDDECTVTIEDSVK